MTVDVMQQREYSENLDYVVPDSPADIDPNEDNETYTQGLDVQEGLDADVDQPQDYGGSLDEANDRVDVEPVEPAEPVEPVEEPIAKAEPDQLVEPEEPAEPASNDLVDPGAIEDQAEETAVKPEKPVVDDEAESSNLPHDTEHQEEVAPDLGRTAIDTDEPAEVEDGVKPTVAEEETAEEPTDKSEEDEAATDELDQQIGDNLPDVKDEDPADEDLPETDLPEEDTSVDEADHPEDETSEAETETADADGIDGRDGDSGHPDESTTGFNDPEDPDKDKVDLSALALEIQRSQYVDLPRLKAEFGEESDEYFWAQRDIEERIAEFRILYFESLEPSSESDMVEPVADGSMTEEDNPTLPVGIPETTDGTTETATEQLTPIEWPNRYVPIETLKHNPIVVTPGKSLYLGPINPIYDPFINPDVALDSKAMARAMSVARIDQLELDLVRNTELSNSDNLYDIVFREPTEDTPGTRAIVQLNRDFLVRWQSSWQQYMDVVKMQPVNPRDPTQLLIGLNRMVGGAISELAMRKPGDSVITSETGHNYALKPQIVFHNFISRTQRLHIFVNRPSSNK